MHGKTCPSLKKKGEEWVMGLGWRGGRSRKEVWERPWWEEGREGKLRLGCKMYLKGEKINVFYRLACLLVSLFWAGPYPVWLRLAWNSWQPSYFNLPST